MKPFDLLKAPLSGTNLIEASAGTGKTYTIAGLFLRLLLEKHLTVDQILVVTFTKAATEELKGRIRNKLLEARRVFTSGSSSDMAVSDLISRMDPAEMALERIQDAIRDFDSTAIFTIHGFCQRVLTDHAFETGDRFDTELMTEPTSMLRSVADDFWRRRFYKAVPEFIQYTLNKMTGPEFFYTLLQKARFPGIRVIPDLDEPEIGNLGAFRDQLTQIRRVWPDVGIKIQEILKDPCLSGVVYGGFKEDKKVPGATVREIRVAALIKQMNRFVEEDSPDLPIWKGFDKFTADKVQACVKKGHDPISHPFFLQCNALKGYADALVAEMDAYLVYLKSECLKFGQKELLERKKRRNVQFFDDLLLMVNQALMEKQGSALASKIRHRYRAALVDEFQDTDLVQYEIFTRIFSKKDRPLFMIGDPKQAIYSFRGADVFSYMKASAHAERRYTLFQNYRSTPEMITAVNTIFSNMAMPFIFEEIPFEKGEPGNKPALPTTGSVPFRVWFLSPQEGLSMTVQDATQSIVHAVTGEIARLISTPAGKANPGDIAVLVRTNKQAVLAKESLSRARIPAVIYSAGNVMDSSESHEIGQILLGISNPVKESTLKAALCTDILGATVASIDPSQMENSWWESRIEDFMGYHRLWHDRGFMPMFRLFMNMEGIRERLLSLPHGERRLTNVLHLSEILHTASMEKKLGVTGLLKWYFVQKEPDTPRQEIHQLRLESDENAVKVITIHKSKGLEFPIVFCPFGWGQSQVSGDDFTFHDMDADRHITLDLGSGKMEDHRVMAQNELLAENLRLLYVAVTRAIERCYLVWPRIRYTKTSALAYLFHGLGPDHFIDTSENLVLKLRDASSSVDPETFLKDMRRLERNSEGSIAVSPLPVNESPVVTQLIPDRKSFRVRTFSRSLDRRWRVSSYSALVSGRTRDNELPDRDELPGLQDHDGAQYFEDALGNSDTAGKRTMFSFPKGAASGIFFHDILEHLDFVNEGLTYRQDLVLSKLSAYGFDPAWVDVIVQMLADLSTIELSPDTAAFSLSSVDNAQRINEMSFYFPLQNLSRAVLKQIFIEFSDQEVLRGFPEKMERLTFSPVKGLMKGYLDVLFQHEGRYFIVDWKSNFLGATLETYQRNLLNEEMQKAFYVLQYHLYVLATHLHLQMKLPGYVYERDFGGAFYIFLRGIDATKGSGYGIFEDRPDIRLVDALGKALIPNYNKR